MGRVLGVMGMWIGESRFVDVKLSLNPLQYCICDFDSYRRWLLRDVLSPCKARQR